jgi:hypothetical protein
MKMTTKKMMGLLAVAAPLVMNQAFAQSTSPFDNITGSISGGYDSEYYFRGLWFSSNNAWGSVNLSMPVAEKLTLNFGALYTDGLQTDIEGAGYLDYSELDLMASLSYDAGWAKFGAVYTNYTFYDTFSGELNGNGNGFPGERDSNIDGADEFGLTMAVPLGAFNVYLSGYYDFQIETAYFELGADYTYAVSEKLSLVPSMQLGYAGGEYYTYQGVTGVDNGFTHLRAGITAPYKATDSLTITPYIACNFALEARKDINTARDENDVFGGISATYAF